MQEYKTNLPEPIYKDLLKKCTEYLKLETYDPGEILFYHKSEIDRIIVVARGCIDLYEPKSNEELLAEISEIQEILFKNKTQNAHEIIRELEDTRQALLDKKYYNSPKYQRSIPQKAARVMSMFQALWGYQVLREPTHDKEAHMFFDKEINSSLKYLDSGLTKVKKVTSQTLGYSLLKPEEVKNETLYPYTAVASVPSQVIVIEKDKYLKVFETLKVKLEAKWKFFGDYLENKTAKIVKNFYKAFKERTFKKNQRIFQQDDLCNEVYAVAQGEVEV